MIQVRPAQPQDLPEITALLRNANDTPYDLWKVAEEKCFGQGTAGVPRTLLAISSKRTSGLVVSCGGAVRLIAVDRRHRRRGVGGILLREAEQSIAQSGAKSIDVGTEPGNYFVPGIPAGDEGFRRFFHLHGYSRLAEDAVDLEVNLAGNPLIQSPAHQGIRRAAAEDRAAVLQFIEKQFGRAWGMEAGRAFDHAEPTLFIARENDRLVGFSAHDANNRGLGFFGPAGIIGNARGRGLGRMLLLASLADLRRLGFQETIIAWAAAHEFYRRFAGAVVAHTYLHMRKTL